MTYIVSGGALNSTHSLCVLHIFRQTFRQVVREFTDREMVCQMSMYRNFLFLYFIVDLIKIAAFYIC